MATALLPGSGKGPRANIECQAVMAGNEAAVSF